MESESTNVLLLATRSTHKAREIADILGAVHGLRILTLDDAGLAPVQGEDRLERFDTFAANAIAKAEFFCARSGMPVIADDSGLHVDALRGQPAGR